MFATFTRMIAMADLPRVLFTLALGTRAALAPPLSSMGQPREGLLALAMLLVGELISFAQEQQRRR